MSTIIKEILSPLDPHWDRIIRRPMSTKEIKDLQKLVGVPVPELFRDYLAQVGLFQDLTSWGSSPIEMYTSPAEFASARQFLSDFLKPSAPELFPFGGDGAGNEFCLPTDPTVPCRIHFFDHETGKVSRQKEFTVWLESVVKKVLRGIRKRPPNERKVWAVEFSLPGISFADLVGLLTSIGHVKQLDPEWMNSRTSPAEVTTTERRLEFNGEIVQVSRSEFADWDAPRTSFSMREPVLKGLERSQIRALDKLFKEKCPRYRLGDYGPLDIANDAEN